MGRVDMSSCCRGAPDRTDKLHTASASPPQMDRNILRPRAAATPRPAIFPRYPGGAVLLVRRSNPDPAIVPADRLTASVFPQHGATFAPCGGSFRKKPANLGWKARHWPLVETYGAPFRPKNEALRYGDTRRP